MLWRNSRAPAMAQKPAMAVEQNLQRKQYLVRNQRVMAAPSACLIRVRGYFVRSGCLFGVSKWVATRREPAYRGQE